MAIVTRQPDSNTSTILNEEGHILFVEGASDESVDVKALKVLFGNRISIKPLGGSFHIESAAQALQIHHPTYYFIIDRDFHKKDSIVQESWDTFPDSNSYNLIIWRKKEIENYFLDSSYLIRSKYCIVTQDKLENEILTLAKQRVYLDAANYVVIGVREDQKRNWIGKFTDLSKFRTKDDALNELIKSPGLNSRSSEISRMVSLSVVEQRFNDCLGKMTNGKANISYGTGDWINMLSGKSIFSQVANSNCFDVKDKDGNQLRGKERFFLIVKDLLSKDDSILPDDFVELKNMILQQVG